MTFATLAANVHGSELRCRAAIETTLRTWLDRVDNLCLPDTAKLWLCQQLIVAKLSWPFTSLDQSLSFANHLQALAAAYLKRWSGLSHPENVAFLHTGSLTRVDLRITHLVTFWKPMQAVAWTFSNNPLTVVVPTCITDSCSARNRGEVGVRQQLSRHVH